VIPPIVDPDPRSQAEREGEPPSRQAAIEIVVEDEARPHTNPPLISLGALAAWRLFTLRADDPGET
jgi:hypothetical protein